MKKIICFSVILFFMAALAGMPGCSKKSNPVAITSSPTLVPSVTPNATYTWIVSEPAVPVTDAYSVCADVDGDTMYAAYQSGAGPGKQLNVKSFTTYGGWQDVAVNMAVSYSAGNPWYDTAGGFHCMVSTDAAGYVYVYYTRPGTPWKLLGTNPVAGPNCAEASIACGWYSGTSLTDITVVYIDRNDGDRLKGRYIDTYNIPSGWTERNPNAAISRVNRINESGSISLISYTYVSASIFLSFASADLGNVVSLPSFGYSSPISDISTSGTSEYISNGYNASYGAITAYRDNGLGGRAVVKNHWVNPWDYTGTNPVSDSPAKYINLNIASWMLIGFADEAASDALVMKKFYSSYWTNIGAPSEKITSCGVGVYSYTKPFAVISGTAANSRRLKLVYAQ